MSMFDQKRFQNNRKVKKSHLLIFGSFLIFVGLFFFFLPNLERIRDEVFSEMKLLMMDPEPPVKEEVISNTPIAEEVEVPTPVEEEKRENVINWDQYLGILEIPRIGLKRGFYDTSSPYNNIEQNVTVIRGSTMPDVNGGNLMLMAHSGDAYISYFAYLYRLQIGNEAHITYGRKKYIYKIVNIYTVDKVGSVTIYRNYDKTTLTLITCTKDDSTKQTIYIAELVS